MDERLRGINSDQSIRVVTAVTTELTREACARHGLEGLEAVVMGRALTAGCLLATLTKNDDERVRIDIRGGGPVGQVLVDAHGDGAVRGCFTRSADHGPPPPGPVQGRASVSHLVGSKGRLVVTRDLGLDQSYQGVLTVDSGEIDRDIERYLTDSEQLPSIVACEVSLDNRGQIQRVAGVLCQTFPEAPGGALDELRSNLHTAFADLMLHERTTEELMGFALLGGPFKAMEPQALEFRCNCGRERALAVVSTLGAEDIEELAKEQGKTDVKCTYCGRVYILSKDDPLELAETLRNERS